MSASMSDLGWAAIRNKMNLKLCKIPTNKDFTADLQLILKYMQVTIPKYCGLIYSNKGLTMLLDI